MARDQVEACRRRAAIHSRWRAGKLQVSGAEGDRCLYAARCRCLDANGQGLPGACRQVFNLNHKARGARRWRRTLVRCGFDTIELRRRMFRLPMGDRDDAELAVRALHTAYGLDAA